MKTVYSFDTDGNFVGSDFDFNQGLPHNSTYKKPPEDKEGFLIKWDGKKWIQEALPEPEPETATYIPTEEEIYEAKKRELWEEYKLAEFAGEEEKAGEIKEKMNKLKEEHEAAE